MSNKLFIKLNFLEDNHVIEKDACDYAKIYVQAVLKKYKVQNEELLDMFILHMGMSIHRLLSNAQEDMEIPEFQENLNKEQVDEMIEVLHNILEPSGKIFQDCELRLIRLHLIQLIDLK